MMKKKIILYLVILLIVSLLGLGEYLRHGYIQNTWALLIGVSLAHWTSWKLPG